MNNNTSRWIDEYADFLYQHAWTFVQCGETAEQLLLQTFRFADQHGNQDALPERNWLQQILRKQVLRHFDRNICRTIPSDVLDTNLASPLREVFLFREVEQMSVSEIASALHFETEEIHRILHLARLQLYSQSSRNFNFARASAVSVVEAAGAF